METIQPTKKERYETNAIVVDSWGWEQTNIDFYVILKRKGDFVTLQKMAKTKGHEKGFLTFECLPEEIDKTSKPFRKKVKTYNGKEIGFSLRPYTGGGWCTLWDGQPVTQTEYA